MEQLFDVFYIDNLYWVSFKDLCFLSLTLVSCYYSREVKHVWQPILQAFDYLCRPSCVKVSFQNSHLFLMFFGYLIYPMLRDIQMLSFWFSLRIDSNKFILGLWSLIFFSKTSRSYAVLSQVISRVALDWFLESTTHYEDLFCLALLQRSSYDFETWIYYVLALAMIFKI